MSAPNRYTLTDPCADCPFRADKVFHLRRARAEEIADTLAAGAEFYCHKTLDYGGDDYDDDGGPEVVNRSRACAGAAIVLANEGSSTQLRRIASALGLPVAELNMDAPVFDSLDEFVEAMERNER